MKKKLVTISAMLLSVSSYLLAQDVEACYLVINGRPIAVDQIEYIEIAPNELSFSVAMVDQTVIENVTSASVDVVYTSIENVVADRVSVKVYPNPTVAQLTIEGINGVHDVAVYNTQGTLVMQEVVGNGNNTIDVTTLPEGIYLLQTDGLTLKFVKK